MWLDSIKKLFKKEEPEQTEPEEEYTYICPKCGSSHIGYYTGLVNFAGALSGKEEPIYGQSARCIDCGFKTRTYLESEKVDCVVELVMVKKDV